MRAVTVSHPHVIALLVSYGRDAYGKPLNRHPIGQDLASLATPWLHGADWTKKSEGVY